MTQKEQILSYLELGNYLTEKYAKEELKCASPRKIISRLKDDGYNIQLSELGYFLNVQKKESDLTYEDFIASKEFSIINVPIEINREDLNPNLFEYQKDLIYLALKKGKFALFAMTGTGKTAMQGEWCYQVNIFTNEPVIIFAPLSVAPQTIQEVKEILGYEVNYCESQEDVINGINISNYEKLHKFDLSVFSGVALDESSILKSFISSTTEAIIEGFRHTKYKLACTATPAPNDYIELGNHSEFLNVMGRSEMLATFFVHDGGETSKWRLKGHARDKFWEWVSHWAVLFTKPSDIGYSEEEDAKFALPNINFYEHIVPSKASGGSLFAIDASTLNERRQARRDSLNERCSLTSEIVNNSNDIFIAWCDLNIENDLLNKVINDSVAIKGSDTDNHKIKAASDFKQNKIKCLITKPSMFGFGQNWQNSHNMVFTGLSDSFEQIFQAIRRCYRYGQKNDVNVHFVISEAEGNVLKNYRRKEKQFLEMIDELVVFTKKFTLKEIKSISNETLEYDPQVDMIIPKFLKSENLYA